MRKLIGVLLLVAATACQGGDSTGPEGGSASLAGSYSLQTANGKAVPTIAIQDLNGTFEVLSGKVVLNADATYMDILSYRTTASGSTDPQTLTDTLQGTYIQFGDNITLTSSGGSVYSMSWIDGNRLAYAESQLTLIYKK